MYFNASDKNKLHYYYYYIRAILREERGKGRKRRAPVSQSSHSEDEEPKRQKQKISNSFYFDLEGIPIGLNVKIRAHGSSMLPAAMNPLIYIILRKSFRDGIVRL